MIRDRVKRGEKGEGGGGKRFGGGGEALVGVLKESAGEVGSIEVEMLCIEVTGEGEIAALVECCYLATKLVLEDETLGSS